MSKEDRTAYMVWNKLITDKDFEHKDPDNYIYASLSQPPIKVVKKYNSDDEMDWDVECPNCHKVVNYGRHIFMEAGQMFCDSKGCYEWFKQRGKGNHS